MKRYSTIFMFVFFIFGVLLRVLLWSANPVSNSFDNHFAPILLIMEHGEIPAKDACPQCYHPPLFYLISALTGKISLALGIGKLQVFKMLQFLNCLYGIITLVLVNLIILRLNLSDFSKALSFGVICFLPRHIYMSAMNANDSLSYLLVSVSIYLLIVALDNQLKLTLLLMLSLAMIAAIFTKYTTFILFPVMLFAFACVWLFRSDLSKSKKTNMLVLTIVVPLVCLGIYMVANYHQYGSALPDNYNIEGVFRQPRDPGGIGFAGFNLSKSLEDPLLSPGKLNSFWTLVQGSMWFDIDGKFIRFFDRYNDWWPRYFDWLRGNGNYPGGHPFIPRYVTAIGSALIISGLIPFLLVITGVALILKKNIDYFRMPELSPVAEVIKLDIFIVLAVVNLALVVLYVYRLPFYSAMKASYFLNSIPAFSVFLGCSLDRICEGRFSKNFLGASLLLIFSLVVIQNLQIIATLGIFNIVVR